MRIHFSILLSPCLLMLLIGMRLASSASPAAEDPLAKLEGRWYLTMTNFPMWLKGDKLNPMYHYTPGTRSGVRGYDDVVSYDKKGKERAYVGFDKPLNTDATQFIWRGNGLLFFLTSKWEVLYHTDQFVILHFGKTLFTGGGYDVISREKALDPATLNTVQSKLQELGINEQLTILTQQ
jgi:hypothetical protein